MWKVILLCVFVGITAGELVSYENYKLFNVIPKTNEQLNLLEFYYRLSRSTFDVWNMPIRIGEEINIMVSPKETEWFKLSMDLLDIELKEDNVQRLINLTMEEGQSSSFDFTSYHTLEKIYKNLDDLAERYPKQVKIITGGSTYEGRQIKGVKISFKPNNPGVFLEGGINAREWMAPAVVMYITHQLLSSNDIHTRNMAESYDWYIFPVFNPDGYVYTHTTDRMWTKTRKPYNETIGSNPNKNWGYKWGGKCYDGSDELCDDLIDHLFFAKFNTFAGPNPFSEIETKSMSKYIESIKDKFFAYFSFHSQSSDITYPPDDVTHNTERYDSYMRQIALPFSMSEYKCGYKHVFGTSDLDHGSSIIYIKGTYNKPLVFAYGLQDTFYEEGFFLQPPEQIVQYGQKTICHLKNILKRTTFYLKRYH